MEGKETTRYGNVNDKQAVEPARGIQGGKAAVHECLPSVPVRSKSQEGHYPGTGKAGNRSSDRKGEMTVGCIVKTFIIYDMCKGEQIGIFAKSEEFRRIVHKEMSKVAQ